MFVPYILPPCWQILTSGVLECIKQQQQRGPTFLLRCSISVKLDQPTTGAPALSSGRL